MFLNIVFKAPIRRFSLKIKITDPMRRAAEPGSNPSPGDFFLLQLWSTDESSEYQILFIKSHLVSGSTVVPFNKTRKNVCPKVFHLVSDILSGGGRFIKFSPTSN